MSRCEAQVPLRGLNFHRTRRCSHPGRVEIGGRWFCGVHDPRKKEDLRRAKEEQSRLSREVWKASSTVRDVREEIIEDLRVDALNTNDARRCLFEAERKHDAAIEAYTEFLKANPRLQRRKQ